MHAYYAFMALALARERVAEADQYRLAALARQQNSDRVGLVRRTIARAAFAVARAADDRLVSRELAIR
jgi:hypothetical protein